MLFDWLLVAEFAKSTWLQTQGLFVLEFEQGSKTKKGLNNRRFPGFTLFSESVCLKETTSLLTALNSSKVSFIIMYLYYCGLLSEWYSGLRPTATSGMQIQIRRSARAVFVFSPAGFYTARAVGQFYSLNN